MRMVSQIFSHCKLSSKKCQIVKLPAKFLSKCHLDRNFDSMQMNTQIPYAFHVNNPFLVEKSPIIVVQLGACVYVY